ncbi:MFS transporter [Streptomyces eurythermus]|uniref:MFS transporter n=1 Tax=Streptomyces eurythermus TaxID=42237 RepID=UPI0037033891
MAEPSSPAPSRRDAAAASPRAGEPDRQHAWLIAAMIVTFMLVNYADKSVLGLAAVPIMDELGISNSAYGMVSSSFSLLFSLSGLAVGFVSARVSSRVLLFGMAVVWAVAQLPVLFVASVPALVAGRVLLGAAEGPAASMSMHALYKWFPADRRGLPSALQIGGAALGTMVAAPAVTGLISAFGWRSAFLALAVLSLVWALAWWRIGHDGPYGETGTATAEVSGRLPYRRLLLNGTVLGSIAGAFGGSWALALSHAWLPAYLRTQLDMAPGTAATLISAVSAFSLVLLLSVPQLLDALRRRGLAVRWSHGIPQGIAVAVAALAMTALPFVDARGAHLALLAVAFGGHAIVFPLHYMTTSAVVPPLQRGAVFGIVAASGTLPGLLAPYLTGHLLDSAPSRNAGYTHAFLLSGGVMLVCGLVSLLTVRPDRDARRLGPDAGRPDGDARRPAPDAGRPDGDARRPAPDAGRPDEDARPPAPDAGRPDEDARPPGPSARRRVRSAQRPDEDPQDA